MIILNVRFGRELVVITASLSTTAFGGNACVSSRSTAVSQKHF